MYIIAWIMSLLLLLIIWLNALSYKNTKITNKYVFIGVGRYMVLKKLKFSCQLFLGHWH